MTLHFTRLSDSAREPSRAHPGDAGLDLYADESLVLGPGRRASVGTGIAIALPAGLGGLVLPRSGLAVRHGVTLVNSPGLIDSGYRGELRVPLLNTDRSESFAVEQGDRIAQLIVVAVTTLVPEESESLDDTVRAAGRFGSSGR